MARSTEEELAGAGVKAEAKVGARRAREIESFILVSVIKGFVSKSLIAKRFYEKTPQKYCILRIFCLMDE
jgi:hypothetical protein